MSHPDGAQSPSDPIVVPRISSRFHLGAPQISSRSSMSHPDGPQSQPRPTLVASNLLQVLQVLPWCPQSPARPILATPNLHQLPQNCRVPWVRGVPKILGWSPRSGGVSWVGSPKWEGVPKMEERGHQGQWVPKVWGPMGGVPKMGDPQSGDSAQNGGVPKAWEVPKVGITPKLWGPMGEVPKVGGVPKMWGSYGWGVLWRRSPNWGGGGFPNWGWWGQPSTTSQLYSLPGDPHFLLHVHLIKF